MKMGDCLNLPEMFGCQVFNKRVMKHRLSSKIYSSLQSTIKTGAPLQLEVANEIANAMKEWAIELGATHYTHWFQPMTGITAEKHDSFILPDGKGNVIMDFSGKELVKGESDASSFPSGGIRATFEARGYTAWDPSSFAFVKEGSLYIPTAFCSYTGEALDNKTPLLRSMQAIDKSSRRLLQLLGINDARKVIPNVGAEQEYFIISKESYLAREDLVYTGRTLFGAKPPKGQELDDQYYGQLKPKIVEYMRDLDEELWKLGVNAKTKHNEVAPAQHEMAPVYATANVATDHNQLTMEIMKKVADRHGLVCLLHEKPFEGVNGSGKHNNWSLSTKSGLNLLRPGSHPESNTVFLLFLTAVIKAVDEYQELIRISVASAGNDHRLGANEAPPAILSMYLGDDIEELLEDIETGKTYHAHKHSLMDLGVKQIPKFKQDTTDRNRTSPFAFTGNKFELRMLGSSASIAGCNTTLNTIVAKELDDFSDALQESENINADIYRLVGETYHNHKRIVFNGNGYSEEWKKEAKLRGLKNLATTPDALSCMLEKKNIDVFEKYGVFTKNELTARYEIFMDNYCQVLSIEALTMISMIKRKILPAALKYEKELSELISQKRNISMTTNVEEAILNPIADDVSAIFASLAELETAVSNKGSVTETAEKGMYFKNEILFKMEELRKYVDDLETRMPDDIWPVPTYDKIIYSVI